MAVDHNNPQSRTEEILIATIDGNEYNKLPQSRLEELLLELKQVIEAGGGGGGTTNYNLLSNLPKINNITVKGEMTASDLSLVLAEVGKGLSTNDYSDEEKAKVADLITAIEGILTGTDLDSFGDVETALADKVDKVNGKGLSTNDFTDEYKAAIGSNTSAITAIKDGSELDSFGDVEVALLDKADTSDLGTAAAKDSTNSVSAGSTDLVESGAVKDAIDAAVASAYHHAGTKTVAQLTHDLLIAANEGNVYNITDSGTTTSDFIEGIGKQIDAGDNVGICKVGDVYMFDLLSGLEDTSIFVQKSQTAGLLKNDGTVNTTIENTVAGHTTAIAGKQDTLTFDDTPTDGSNNPVKSNGIYDSEKDIYATMGEMGAKNLISYPYHQNTKTEYGVTFTNNGDGSVTVSTVNTGATAEATFICHNRLNTEANELRIKNGKYILSGCPQGGSATTYLLTTNRTYNGSSEAMGNEYGSGKVITLNGDDYGADGVNLGISIVINSGTIITTPITFKPMLRLASDTDGTYQPYAKTNKQLTDDVTLLDSEKTDTDIVASDFSTAVSYTAGDYCIYGGKFYKFKNNHSGAWSASDVDEIKIAGELSSLKSGLTNVSGEVDTLKNGIVYGFHIDGSVSDPSNRVTYLRDAIGKTPAYMDYNEGSFNYGSWEDAFFMPRPCMVERSGNVAYYLNPNDYTKKADGTASDVADTSYGGNAMMEWGRNGKKIWMKIDPDSGDANSCSVYIADHRVDATYHDWPFHNCNGVSVDHFYTPIYNGSAVSDGTNNVLRSLSGQYISHTQDASTEITMAGRNNAGSAEIWGTEVYADIVLINMLLTLIGKSTNSQAVFGRGLDSGSETAMKAYVTGALNDKGLFFGYNDGDHGVKVFGMENWWACQWRRYRGHIMVDGVQKVKLTYGTEDGSTAAGYNLTGDNYISVGATPTGTSGQYCDKYEFSPNGAFPKNADNTKATASTHYCDGLWFNNSGTRMPFRGGSSNDGSLGGAWYVHLINDASRAGWSFGAALSCKPLA